MTNYNQALETLNNRTSRKIGNNTYLKKLDDCIAVLLHDTYIVKYYPKYNQYFTGGWNTHTTKDRLNTYGDINIYQKNGLWYVGNYLFFDGLKSRNGEIIGKKLLPEKTEKKIKKIKAKIAKYIQDVGKKYDEGIAKPSSGDCWYCSMRTDDGKTLGDIQDNDHLLHHFEEKYVVPSLIWNAITEAGYRYPELIVGWTREDELSRPNYGSKTSVLCAVRKYLNKRLIKL